MVTARWWKQSAGGRYSPIDELVAWRRQISVLLLVVSVHHMMVIRRHCSLLLLLW